MAVGIVAAFVPYAMNDSTTITTAVGGSCLIGIDRANYSWGSGEGLRAGDYVRDAYNTNGIMADCSSKYEDYPAVAVIVSGAPAPRATPVLNADCNFTASATTAQTKVQACADAYPNLAITPCAGNPCTADEATAYNNVIATPRVAAETPRNADLYELRYVPSRSSHLPLAPVGKVFAEFWPFIVLMIFALSIFALLLGGYRGGKKGRTL